VAGTIVRMPRLAASPELVEHAAGRSVREIAARHRLAKSTVHRMIQRDGAALLDSMEADLTAGRGIEVLVPYGQLEVHWMANLQLVDWVAAGLRDRGYDVHARNVRCQAGSMFRLTLPGGPQ
jgi:hypothetical protein